MRHEELSGREAADAVHVVELLVAARQMRSPREAVQRVLLPGVGAANVAHLEARVARQVAHARERGRVLVEFDFVEKIEAHLSFAQQMSRPVARTVARAQRFAGTRTRIRTDNPVSRIASLLFRLASVHGFLCGRLGTRGRRDQPTSCDL